MFGNVAFGLQVARVGRGEQRERVAEALALVRLEGYEKRRSHELSGGQMQRVALARALVNRPAVLLLDEPLSALDLKIRLEMEVELRRVHRETGATFVYVTHDQREAMALSDRLVVIERGPGRAGRHADRGLPLPGLGVRRAVRGRRQRAAGRGARGRRAATLCCASASHTRRIDVPATRDRARRGSCCGPRRFV